MNDKESLKRAFDNTKNGQFEELSFLEFNDLINKLNIDPVLTQAKVIASRYQGFRKPLKYIDEAPWVVRNRKARAIEKLKFECNISDEIKDAFENYFKKSGENKMDMFDFYQILEKSEVDVENTCVTLNNQHYKRSW